MLQLLPTPRHPGVPRPGAAGAGPLPRLGAGWPLTALLVLYPLWWALGLGTLIVFLLAVPMVVHLCRRPQVRVPPGFGLWVLFLLWVLASTSMLGQNPPGTLPDSVGGRILSVGFNLAGYLSATVVLLYAGNLTEAEFPRRRLVRQLSLFFTVVVAGGLLGILAPTFEFTSLVEILLPQRVSADVFVRSLVHPSAAQLQDVLGYTSPRPSAPFGFTNTWGHCLALLIGWFAVGWLVDGDTVRRMAGVVVLAAATVPVVLSLNRGLWIGFGLLLVGLALRLAGRGRGSALAVLLVSAVLTGAVLAVSPLGATVQARLENPHSNDTRTFTTERTLEVIGHSPIIGLGSTRAALGSSNSIAVGQDEDCRRCGNHTLGSNGQLWLLLVAQGVGGALLYVGFLLRSMWAYRRDRSPIGDAGQLALGVSLFFLLIYNALVMPLVLLFLSIALLWRNQQHGGPAQTPAPSVPGVLQRPRSAR
jgi:O-antigen ligase